MQSEKSYIRPYLRILRPKVYSPSSDVEACLMYFPVAACGAVASAAGAKNFHYLDQGELHIPFFLTKMCPPPLLPPSLLLTYLLGFSPMLALTLADALATKRWKKQFILLYTSIPRNFVVLSWPKFLIFPDHIAISAGTAVEYLVLFHLIRRLIT